MERYVIYKDIQRWSHLIYLYFYKNIDILIDDNCLESYMNVLINLLNLLKPFSIRILLCNHRFINVRRFFLVRVCWSTWESEQNFTYCIIMNFIIVLIDNDIIERLHTCECMIAVFYSNLNKYSSFYLKTDMLC